MKIINRSNIDTDKWDQRIASSPIENIFCYSWYLDHCAKDWSALITDNYNTILPLPYTKNLGVKQLYQPTFTRELDIFGNEFDWHSALTHIKKEFKAFQFRNSQDNILPTSSLRKHQWLKLNSSELKYSTNAKRLIKKAAKHFEIRAIKSPKKLTELFEETAFQKVDSLNKTDMKKLEELMEKALSLNAGEMLAAFDKEKMVAAGYFLKDKSRITYLKGASTDEAKKNGAMYGIIDAAIEQYQQGFTTFDFGGSDVENVATFYKKFGASDRLYYEYQSEALPSWFKTLKKIKR